MLIDDLRKRKSELESEVGSLVLKLEPMEDELRKKREMLQHIGRMIELEVGDEGPESAATVSELSELRNETDRAPQTRLGPLVPNRCLSTIG